MFVQMDKHYTMNFLTLAKELWAKNNNILVQ